MAILLTARAPVTAQLTFVTPIDTASATADSSAWVAAEVEGDRVAPHSAILDSLAPGEVLVEPSIVHDVASRPRGSFFSAASQQPPHPAVVRVIAAEQGGASLGSGTLVDVNDEHGLVITNWHVVRDAPASVIVVFPDGFQSLGRVLRMDANWDLAAILINKPRAAPVRLAADAPQIGETLTIAGYGGGPYRAVAGPCTQYLAPSVQHPQELVELAASARQGDSGGPIFNARGELAGVLFGEASGRTTGAYCGRVHSFLAAAVQQLYPPDRTALAAKPASIPSPQTTASSSARGTMGNSETFDNGATPHSAVSELPAGGRQRRSPASASGEGLSGQSLVTQQADLRIGDNSLSDPSRELAATAASRSFYSATPAPPADRTERETTAPLAAITTPVETRPFSPQGSAGAIIDYSAPQRRAQDSHGSSSANEQPLAAPGAVDSPDWRFFAGETLVAQVKTVLACVGIASILFHGARTLTRTASGGSSAKRRKK